MDSERDQFDQNSPRFEAEGKRPVFAAGQRHRLHSSQLSLRNGAQKGRSLCREGGIDACVEKEA